MLMKCKPTYQFQSVEFDYNVVTPKDLSDMFEMYNRVLKGLMEFAPIQEKQLAPKDPPATQRQKDIMDLHGIKYKPDVTTKEAQALIQRSINGN